MFCVGQISKLLRVQRFYLCTSIQLHVAFQLRQIILFRNTLVGTT